MVERDVATDILGAFARKRVDAAQHAALFHRGNGSQGLEYPRCGGQRAVQIGHTGVRQVAENVSGGRVQDILSAAPAALDELTVDIQQ